MPLKQTQQLMDTFGKDLTDGSISDKNLHQLLKIPFGEAQTWFDIKQPISEKNHNSIHSSYDFVQTICEILKPQIRHDLIRRMLDLTKDIDNFDFTQINRPNITLIFLEIVRINVQYAYNPKIVRLYCHSSPPLRACEWLVASSECFWGSANRLATTG